MDYLMEYNSGIKMKTGILRNINFVDGSHKFCN